LKKAFLHINPGKIQRQVFTNDSFKKLVRITGWAAMSLFLVTALTPLTNVAARAFVVAPRINPASAIVVLGAGLNGDGELSDNSMRRAVKGISLYTKGLAPVIVFSGPSSKAEIATEGWVRAKLAQDLGVPREAIAVVDDARTTQQESIRIADLLSEQGEKKILLVTDSLHMRRAMLVFERADYEVLSVPSDDPANVATTPTARMKLAIRLAQETAALVYYRIVGYL